MRVPIFPHPCQMDKTSLYWENYRAIVLKAIDLLELCCNCLGDLGQEPLLPWHLSVLTYKVEGLEQMASDFPLCPAFIHSVT